nr:Maf family protein [Clostridia bacterium]
RRRELLAQAGLEFTVRPSSCSEPPFTGGDPGEYVAELARLKADAAEADAGDTVLAADTVVCLDGAVLGKPKDVDDARRMLSELSGNTHCVYTGVCIRRPGKEPVVFYEKTDVTFYELSEEEINDYVATGEPMDKAGAYGIQGRGCLLVREIRGDWCNVVGLPVARVVRALRGAG